MRILYLIGNGFDLHVGLKTSYPDFLKYYLKQPIPAELDDVAKRYIKRLKEDINDNIELWSDLELRFGKHMSHLGKMGKGVHTLEEELDIINDDIREKLSVYIGQEDKRAFFAENAQKAFIDDILAPERNLRDYEKKAILNHRRTQGTRTPHVVDIITFNYTRTLEHLLGETPVQASGFEIHEPIHVHGYHDNRMIFGVNDVSQIHNEKLRELTYAKEALVKSECNHIYGVSHTDRCDDLIYDAQLICCYGLSFGETDKLWWKKICNTLKSRNDLYVIVFAHIKDMPNYSNSGHKLQQQIRLIQHDFLKKGEIEESLWTDLSSRIFVSLNNSIFNIQVDDRTPIEKLVGKPAPGTVERLEADIQTIEKSKR